MEKLIMSKRCPDKSTKKLFTSVNLRVESAALVDEVAMETGRTKTYVLAEMIRFAYEHLELVDMENE